MSDSVFAAILVFGPLASALAVHIIVGGATALLEKDQPKSNKKKDSHDDKVDESLGLVTSLAAAPSPEQEAEVAMPDAVKVTNKGRRKTFTSPATKSESFPTLTEVYSPPVVNLSEFRTH